MSGSNELELSKSDNSECIIKYSKVIIITFITANIIGFAIYFNIADYHMTKSYRENIYPTCGTIESFVLLFTGVCLFINVFWLINRLKKKKQSLGLNVESANFNKEICILWIILSTFSVTYVIRGTWPEFIVPHLSDWYGFTLVQILFGILFDLIPITLILVLHLRNFREKNVAHNELRIITVR